MRAGNAVAALMTAATCAVIAPSGVANAAPTSPNEVAGCGTTGVHGGSNIARSTVINGQTRTYRIHVPAGYNSHAAVPLILAFHGRNEKSTSFETYSKLSTLPAAVVYADGLPGRGGQRSWQSAPYANPKADDVEFTRAILRDSYRTLCVDTNRTFAVGRSNGGGLIALLACRIPNKFAAFAAVSGAFYPESTRSCVKSPGVSVLEFHGTADPVIHYNGGRRFDEVLPSVPSWLSTWTRKADCLDAPIEVPVNQFVTRVDWPFCSPVGTEIVHYRITGGTHRWPGSAGGRHGGVSDSIDATGLIWDFFRWHPRR